MDSMVKEYHYIIKNDVLDVVLRPKDKPIVSSKWIFKKKHSIDGFIEKYKARFVAQKDGIDYEDTFSLVARYTSIRTILALASKLKWKLH